MPTPVQLAQEAQAIFDSAERKGRGFNSDEREYIEGLLERAEEQNQFHHRVKSLPGIEQLFAPDGTLSAGGNGTQGGPGDLFIASQSYKSLRDSASRAQQWSTGPIDVGPQYKAGTLFESGAGAGLIPVPQVEPRIVSKLFEQPTVADVFAGGIGQPRPSGTSWKELPPVARPASRKAAPNRRATSPTARLTSR